MDLKTRKYINNGKYQSLPKFSLGVASIALDSLKGFMSSAITGTTPNVNVNELLMKYGTSRGSVGGIGYEILNSIDVQNELEKEEAAATSEALSGGLPGIIGGLLSRGDRMAEARRRIKIAQNKAQNKTLENKSRATSEFLTKQYDERYGDPTSLQLFEAANGKRPVWSSNGLTGKKENALVSNGEVLGSLEAGTVTRIPGRKNNKDTKLAALSDGDFVISNKYGLSDYAAATGDYLGALSLLENLLGNMRNKHGYKNGKLPRLENGTEWLGNFVPSLSGALIGLGQYSDAKNQDVYKPDTFKANPYTQVALNDLDKLRISAYPIMLQQRAAETRAASAINQSGGLSAGQRAISRIASLNTTQQNIANALASIQQQNNAYRANAAQARLNVGNQEATRQQTAEQWDTDMYAKAHAARQQGMLMGMYNFQNALEQYFANEFKRKLFDKTYGLYAADVKNQKDYIDFLKGQNTTLNNITNPTNNYWTSVRRDVETKSNPNGEIAFASMLHDIDDRIKNMPEVPTYNPTSLKTKSVATRPSRKVTTKSSNTPNAKKSTISTKPQTTTLVYSQSPLVYRPSEYEYGFKNIPQMVEYNRQNALGGLSNTDAKKPKKMRKGTPKTNAEALRNLVEYMVLGQREYNKRYK